MTGSSATADTSAATSNLSASSGPVLAEPGKRIRRKMSLLSSALSTDRLEKSPASEKPVGSPAPGSPEARGFPARRRSIASPARQRSFQQTRPVAAPEVNEEMLQIVPVGGVVDKPRKADSS